MAGIPHLIENASRSESPLFLGLRVLGCRRQSYAECCKSDPGRDHVVCLGQPQAAEGIEQCEVGPDVVDIFTALLNMSLVDVS
jgi:hypothetical protein